MFKNPTNPNITFPPEPIIISWEIWLQTVNYYYLYYESIKNVIFMLDSKHAAPISEGKDIFQIPNIKSAILFYYIVFFVYCFLE